MLEEVLYLDWLSFYSRLAYRAHTVGEGDRHLLVDDANTRERASKDRFTLLELPPSQLLLSFFKHLPLPIKVPLRVLHLLGEYTLVKLIASKTQFRSPLDLQPFL